MDTTNPDSEYHFISAVKTKCKTYYPLSMHNGHKSWWWSLHPKAAQYFEQNILQETNLNKIDREDETTSNLINPDVDDLELIRERKHIVNRERCRAFHNYRFRKSVNTDFIPH